MSAVQLFFGAVFITAENTDIYFEVNKFSVFVFMRLEIFSEETAMSCKIALTATILRLRELFRKIKTPPTIFSSVFNPLL